MALVHKSFVSNPVKSQGVPVTPAVRAKPVARRVRSARAQATNALTVAQPKAVTNGVPVAVPAFVEEVDLAKHMQDRHAHVLR